MSVEQRRLCGYRRVGGLYVVSGALSAPCGRLPLELHVCPTCSAGVKQARGWTWVKPAQLLADAKPCTNNEHGICGGCILSPHMLTSTFGVEKAGLLWVGGQFYPEPDDFMREARSMGISKRIVAIPRGFKLGESWVLIAHPKAIKRLPETPEEEAEVAEAQEPGKPLSLYLIRKGVITAFKPTAIEKIVTDVQAQDEEAMAALEEKGITPVIVPADDPDHNPDAKRSTPQPEPPQLDLLRPQAG